jgi:ubiquinone biosynthesis protein UbiJ
VAVSGDEELMRRFQEVARLLRPDGEAAAGRVMGRIPAHLAMRAFSAFAGWGRAAGESLARNAADYLAHESRDLVPRAESESLFAGVDALRAQTAAAEARLTRLAERLDAATAVAAVEGAAGHSTRRDQP